MRIAAVGKLKLRVVRAVVLGLAAVGCDNPNAPVPTYTLVSINGLALPAQVSPGGSLVESASLALYADGTVRSRVRYICPPPPPDALCSSSEIDDTGLYSREAADVTFGDYTNPATFEANQVVITFGAGPYWTGGAGIWRYTR